MAAQWFVVETSVGKEKFAKNNLMGQGFETYLPMFMPSWGSKPKVSPFLPGYLFIAAELDGEGSRWNEIITTMGVNGILGMRPPKLRPVPVPWKVIEELQLREQDGIIQLPGSNMDKRRWLRLLSRLEQGDAVSIVGSALKAIFEKAVDRRHASVLVEFLGKKHKKIVPFSRLDVV